MAPALRASNPAGTLSLAATPSLGHVKGAAVFLNVLLPTGVHVFVGDTRGILVQDPTSYFKADIRVLVNAPSACPADPQSGLWEIPNCLL